MEFKTEQAKLFTTKLALVITDSTQNCIQK